MSKEGGSPSSQRALGRLFRPLAVHFGLEPGAEWNASGPGFEERRLVTDPGCAHLSSRLSIHGLEPEDRCAKHRRQGNTWRRKTKRSGLGQDVHPRESLTHSCSSRESCATRPPITGGSGPRCT
ncbi:Hypothetical predicted protein [Marmota monax]|uniref:Uncharacterized protein n=1 Tax=Marmota monax TaxID=9995 RepID=A0A5E4CZT7_MARMO|nr:Hypothetical predicted protein [Marmota monax]